MYIIAYIKLRSYWTKVYQIVTQCSQVIIDEFLEIRMAILQSVLECQGLQINVNSPIFPTDPKIGCHGNVP